MITLTQGTRYLLAPNEAFDRITGYKPGEACPKLDFVERIWQSLNEYGIDLFLYYTGDGPSRDPAANKAFGTINYGADGARVTGAFVRKWAEVAREYSLRYGDKIKGWWVDGCYGNIGYDTALLKILEEALRAGNPDAALAFNYRGCMDEYAVLYTDVPAPTPLCDYTAGELVRSGAVPFLKMYGNARWHILSFLGVPRKLVAYDGWGAPGSAYTGEWMREYVKKVRGLNGIVTADIFVSRDGRVDPEQLEALSHLRGI